jgi:starch-binding outer membrane protein, SusD/RagB family
VDAAITDTKVSMEPYTNIKFGQRSGIGSLDNDGDWCLMRAEEMILIRAEALAKSGSLEAGKQVLSSFVTTYRNPSFTSSATTVAAFENEVWLQRRIELWGEGFSFVDIMRLNKNLVRFHLNETTNLPDDYKFNIASGNPWLLLRITQRAIVKNEALIDANNTGGEEPRTEDEATLTDGVTD